MPPFQLVAEAQAQIRQVDIALANKDANIVLYCKTGGRAALAALNLQRMGYTNVRSLIGGLMRG